VIGPRLVAALHADAEIAVVVGVGYAPALAAVGERFEPGDRVITGSVVQVPVQPGDEVTADFGSLGQVSLRIA